MGAGLGRDREVSGSWAGERGGGEWEVGLGRDREVSGSWAGERWRGEWELGWGETGR